jgi:hypothetical protein
MKPEAPRGDWQSTQTETDVLLRLQVATSTGHAALLPAIPSPALMKGVSH